MNKKAESKNGFGRSLYLVEKGFRDFINAFCRILSETQQSKGMFYLKYHLINLSIYALYTEILIFNQKNPMSVIAIGTEYQNLGFFIP